METVPALPIVIMTVVLLCVILCMGVWVDKASKERDRFRILALDHGEQLFHARNLLHDRARKIFELEQVLAGRASVIRDAIARNGATTEERS